MSDEEIEARLLARLRARASDYPRETADPGRLKRLALFLSELTRWRGATDLVGRLTDEDLVDHALESALGARLLAGGERLLDIGSGAGFPGIALAIFGIRTTLLEPRERRAAFLKHVLRTIPGLNAEVRVARVEQLREPEFDAASARAVGNLGGLIGEGKFLRDGGRLLLWTAGAALAARGVASGRFRKVAEEGIPGSRSRRILVFEKCSTGNIRA